MGLPSLPKPARVLRILAVAQEDYWSRSASRRANVHFRPGQVSDRPVDEGTCPVRRVWDSGLQTLPLSFQNLQDHAIGIADVGHAPKGVTDGLRGAAQLLEADLSDVLDGRRVFDAGHHYLAAQCDDLA